ncbi:Arc family DNA-binding protein [Castellaniella ginsengisoli]|uniref:Arc family DNA-binding protein n=1 Tax=Castellaniella ginsengisoli TaxID=546114 RepID=A0AB39D869_9BURK
MLAAKASGRSMNAEIVARLEGSFEPVEDSEHLKTMLKASVQLLDHKNQIVDAHQRLIQMMGFYLSELAARVNDDSPETAALMRFIKNFGDSMASGKLRDATEHVQDIVDMGVELGIIDKDAPVGEGVIKGEEGRREAFAGLMKEFIDSSSGPKKG